MDGLNKCFNRNANYVTFKSSCQIECALAWPDISQCTQNLTDSIIVNKQNSIQTNAST